LIQAAAQEFGVDAVWLFGSAARSDPSVGDIDLAVEGLSRARFFDFYERLYFSLPKPVDLVDLSQNPPIAPLIRAKGIRIYERGS
jgi:predicted nucleotidyltransferase